MSVREDIPDYQFPPQGEAGNFIVLRHAVGEGENKEFYYTIYEHLKYDSVVPDEEDSVDAGDPIAETDATGHCSDPPEPPAPHLHFRVEYYPETDEGPWHHEHVICPYNLGLIDGPLD